MRKVIIILASLTVLLLLGFCGYRGYELWKQNHWMSLARQYADRNDVKNEVLCLRQVLRYNPNNVEACRMMANLSEAAGSPAALTLRKKILELAPNSFDDRMALVQTALIFKDTQTASNALAGVDDAGKKTAAYFDLSAKLALLENKPAEAEADFAEACRIDPSLVSSQLSLAVLKLHSSNALDIAEARIDLKRISLNLTNSYARTQADRELTIDALRNRDNNTALYYSKQLVEQTNSVFEHKLLRLDVLQAAGSDEYNSTLASYQSDAIAQPNDLTAMTLWMMGRNMSPQVINWLQRQPANIQTNLPAALLIAQCQLQTRDWNGLEKTVSRGNWGGLEPVRNADMAFALRQQGSIDASKAEWDAAVVSANGQLTGLSNLYRLANEWHWYDEAQQLLWTIFNKFPDQQWAGQSLVTMLYKNGSTRPLMGLFDTLEKRNPANTDTKNDLAITAMLLRAEEMKPYELANEVYQSNPTNSFYACTYAFSLHLQGKDADALKIMKQIPPKELKSNSTPGYYGIILKANGDNAQAKDYLKLGLSAPSLLPEERALFKQAMTGL
jgi:thioredoxin-like negative regulator of GroEL